MASSYDAHREQKLGLGLKIFLSYNEDAKFFLLELYEDLVEQDFYPFFNDKSLPISASVSVGNIVQEAVDSKLAVFFLSEAFFTLNENPMMELVECMKKRTRLLPLFYETSVDMIKESIESWYNGEWSKWEVDRNEFKEALETLLHIKGVENKEGLRPAQFRRSVIEEIQKIVCPRILPDVSGICGGDRLVKVVKAMFDKHLLHYETTPAPAVVLGLYGLSGTGKSTLCKMFDHSELELPVCYIQLDPCMDETTQLERMKKTVRFLTDLPTDLIKKLTKPDEAQKKLLEREYQKQVFFIIDNLTAEYLEEARIYLDGGCRWFKPGSKILITACSESVLNELVAVMGPLNWHIAAMPDLEKGEAIQILLKRAGSGSIKLKEELVERCLNLCRFEKGGGKGDHYHPLVLNALAEALPNLYSNHEHMIKWIDDLESIFSPTESNVKGQEHMLEPISWDDHLQSSFNPTESNVKGKEHMLKSISRIGDLQSSFSPTESNVKGQVLERMLKLISYDLLNDLEKQVFLDLAFYLPTQLKGRDEIFEWLHRVHIKNIKETVRVLERRGMIDLSGLLSEGRRLRLMHDLYYEMAALIVEEKGSNCLLFQGDASDKRLSLICKKTKRVSFQKYHFRGDFYMGNFPSLEVLAIISCVGLEKLDLRWTFNLYSLDYLCEGKGIPKKLLILGLNDCFSLFHLSCVNRGDLVGTDSLGKATKSTLHSGMLHFPKLSYLPNLRYLQLDLDGLAFDLPVDYSSCTHLEYLILLQGFEHPDLRPLRNLRVFKYLYCKSDFSCGPVVFQFGHKIKSICIQQCNHVSGLRGLNQNCTTLRELELDRCPALKDVEGLGKLKGLEKLRLIELGFTSSPKLPKQIQFLQIDIPYIDLPDVSGIYGGDRLVKVVKGMFEEHLSYHKSTPAPVVVLGLYGVSGTGKSTLCKMLQHSEMQFPVCYIQLDSCMDETAQLERMKKALRYLTDLPTDLIDKFAKPNEVRKKLLEREYEKVVFLIIDNVRAGSLKEARIYLDGGYRRFKHGSKILITAHSEYVLNELVAVMGPLKCHIAAMPDLEKGEAIQILLKRAGSGSIKLKEELVERCLNLCRFEKGGGKGDHYHPLVLNALAESLAIDSKQETSRWFDSLQLNFTNSEGQQVEDYHQYLQHLFDKSEYIEDSKAMLKFLGENAVAENKLSFL